MKTFSKLLICLLVSKTAFVLCQESDSVSEQCTSAETCRECITKGPQCVWCNSQNFNQARCNTVSSFNSTCPLQFLENPKSDLYITKNILPKDGNTQSEAVQLSPQELNITLRPYEPVSVEVTFRVAKNYPVDLYYLMDHSASMRDDKDKITQLGNKLADTLSKITTDLQMGFGSFVDKVTSPYVSITEAALRSPCLNCAAPYGYKNHLQLTRQTELFAQKVNSTQISGNLDAPEGGFDAIVQAVVCKDQIGWRENSRKILLYASDATFHFAGDGKLGGIIEPNDGLCHLDQSGTYNMTLQQDYPSVSQIRETLIKNDINMIMAVTDSNTNQEPFSTYNRLNKMLEGAVVGKLAGDSSNVVDLVRENYNKISSRIELTSKNSEGISITFHSNCSSHAYRKTNVCENLHIGNTVTFKMTIKVDECPTEVSQRSRTVTISPVGLSEQLRINLNMKCDCDCEKKIHKVYNSTYCSDGNGTYVCGICECNKGRLGGVCECDASNIDSQDRESSCKMPGSDDICSNKGSCVCGKCQCNPRSINSRQRFSGQFCQCDDFSCGYHSGQLCGGSTNGKCSCGSCICTTGYEGDQCECPTDVSPCMAENGEICNGVGECVCNSNTNYQRQCQCTNDKYSGPTCEKCLQCEQQCSKFKSCVQCRVFGTGSLDKATCEAECLTMNITTQSSVYDTETSEFCPYVDETDDCTFYFSYEYVADGNLQIKAQKTKKCPEPINILAIVLGIVGGILALGIALLIIWKVLTTIHDKREYVKFEKERLSAKWEKGNNPLYKEATSRYKNPTYSGNNN